MNKIINKNKNLCCVVKLRSNGEFDLNLYVRRKWLIFNLWIKLGNFVVVSEYSKPLEKANKDRAPRNPMVLEYQYGGKHEVWDYGTLDISKRVEQMFQEYLEGERDNNEFICRQKRKLTNL